MTRPGIKLDVSQIARVDLNLTLGEVRDSVTVIAEAPILTSENATVGQVIGNKKILDLPLNGRDFTQLATLAPGAISRGTNASLEAPAISVNGSRNSKTVFMVDGGSVTSQYFDVASVVPSVDAIQEFTVQSNAFAAENGQGTAIISAPLKSGTNQVHGSAFEFIRGGPVELHELYRGKDRTFIFGDYEGTRIRRAQTFNTAVPSAVMRR